jgi:predicted ATP-grasp superfamily ATP-dependent carboligase
MGHATADCGDFNGAPDLLIVGASARAAAFSALRAGLQPWCVDRYADVDLQHRCPCIGLSERAFGLKVVRAIQHWPICPWMYVGGMENRPRLVQAITLARPLWGNNREVLALVRSPIRLGHVLTDAGLACAAVCARAEDARSEHRWLAKPVRSAGGAGIHFLSQRAQPRVNSRFYYQQFIPGDSYSAAFVGDGRTPRLLGVTRQLIGEDWLHAGAFRYCGSLGPVSLPPATRRMVERFGEVLTNVSHLVGLFGLDFIVNDQVPFLVEVNPRYTASMELLEPGLAVPVLSLHRAAFTGSGVTPTIEIRSDDCVGKAVYFAARALTFPHEGPWSEAGVEFARGALPAFADIPQPGQQIAAGQPVLTFFGRGDSIAHCRSALQVTAAALDHVLLRH